MKFGIVTPSFNQGETLEETIKSVISQNVNLCYFIQDGGSTDQSINIIQKYKDKIHDYHHGKDGGLSRGLNLAFNKIKHCDIFCWINSDDYFLPGSLKKIEKAFIDNPNISVVTGACQRVTYDKRYISNFNIKDNWNTASILRIGQRNGAFYPQPSTFFKSEAFSAVGGLDENLYNVMDIDLWAKLASDHQNLLLEDEIAARRDYNETLTKSQFYRRETEMLYLNTKHNINDNLVPRIKHMFTATKCKDIFNDISFTNKAVSKRILFKTLLAKIRGRL